ncbi:cationic amino acid transporter 4 isoform X2 [Parasteatoda tepidariorum]|uniref:cationic amino acid transporter 4 isoform X2 n=1 Tax=Parasteatoda tepidariorum TaxID=114398 RepID=UPI001C72110D|nr:cationic amino acid transporter 4 isoform X2 [Parasteatoda tepidariorum]
MGRYGTSLGRKSWSTKCFEFSSRLTRKKTNIGKALDTNLRRCLSTLDITLMAVGHMVEAGVYVLTATVAKSMAGPAIVLAFLFSGFASFLAALCYAELGVRYPKSGSAYSYTYMAVGELWAFLVGWNMALEHTIGAAATARAASAYIDSLAGYHIKNGTMSFTGPIEAPMIADYLDFFAVFILFIFVIYLSFGVKMTSYLNNLFTVINIGVIILIIGVGAYFADIKNWTNPETGGFMPYGWSGVFEASASCFYAYIGFEAIAACSEEAKDPKKSIPRATMAAMGIAAIGYIGTATVLTLMVNYKDIQDESGIPEALGSHGAEWAKIAVIVGAVCGTSTGIIGSLFALTRVIYVMADDGLLLNFCSKVNKKTQIPLRAMYVFSFLSFITTLLLDINALVEVISIGTLFAYIVVSASVIILRYKPSDLTEKDVLELTQNDDPLKSNSIPLTDTGGELRDNFEWMKRFIDWSPGKLVTHSVVYYCVTTFLLCGFIRIFSSYLDCWWAIIIVVILLVGFILSFFTISIHKQSISPLCYKVPIVPLVPAMSILVNIILIVNLQPATWVRLFIWIAVGLVLYFFYGIKNSKEEMPPLPSSVRN